MRRIKHETNNLKIYGRETNQTPIERDENVEENKPKKDRSESKRAFDSCEIPFRFEKKKNHKSLGFVCVANAFSASSYLYVALSLSRARLHSLTKPMMTRDFVFLLRVFLSFIRRIIFRLFVMRLFTVQRVFSFCILAVNNFIRSFLMLNVHSALVLLFGIIFFGFFSSLLMHHMHITECIWV